jgi:DNA-binding transcriptional LysR family regulator
MELRQLHTFRTVASTLNFSQAAAILNYVPSNVTMQIQALEEDLGARLFDRLGKHVALTDAGKRFLVYVERALNVLDEGRSTVEERQELMGTVTISAPEVLCAYRLPIILQQFHTRFPRVRLIFHPLPDISLKQSLYEGSTDVVFLMDNPVHSTGLVVESLVEEALCALVSPDHLLASRPTLTAEDWKRELFLLPAKGCTYRTLFERSLAHAGNNAILDLEFNSVEAVKQCAMAGMGIAFLPKIAATTELEQRKLIALPWDEPDFHITTQMLWHKEKWLSPAICAFLSITREVMASC